MTYQRHPMLPDVDDRETVLWRYMDLARWLDLLQTAELHMARADQMEDHWEGAYAAPGESFAMWKLYETASKGVALRTSLGRLHDSLISGPPRQPVYGAAVQYVDYNSVYIAEGNAFSAFTFKRESFAHEHEYRLITP